MPEVTTGQETDQETHGDPRGPEERTHDAAGRGAASRAVLRETVALVDVEIVAGEGTAQEQAAVVMAFDEAHIPRPLIVGRARAVSGGGVPLDSRPLTLESDHRQVDTHVANLTPRLAGVTLGAARTGLASRARRRV